MPLLNFPEDSVLRRHFDANVTLNRQRWLEIPPSDSILRRHAMSQNSSTPAAGSGHGGARRPVATASRSASTAQRTSPESKGFFAWLMGLFSGRN